MKKSVYFFCQLFIAGGAFYQTLTMTEQQAQDRLSEMQASANTKRAYMCQLENAIM